MVAHQCLARLDDGWYNRLTAIKGLLLELGELESDSDYAITRKALEFLIETWEGILKLNQNNQNKLLVRGRV